MSPSVSILTVTYNHERFISECLESVRRQSLSDFEHIIVDDGSKDRTCEIIEGKSHPKLRFIRQENKGIERLAESYNVGLSNCRAPVIAILEGDDLFPNDKLALQVPDFDSNAVVMSSGLVSLLNANGNSRVLDPLPNLPSGALQNDPIGIASRTMIRPMYLNFTFPVSTCIRRSTLEKIGGFQSFPGLPVTDYPTFLRLGLEGKWRWHEQVTGIWRRHDSSTTSSRLPDILEGAYAVANFFANEHGQQLGLSKDEILQANEEWRHFQAVRSGTLARECVASRAWRKATPLFKRASFLAPGVGHRVKYGIAGMLSSLHLSPEPWLRLVRMRPWSELLLIEGDRIARSDAVPNDFALREFM